MEVGRFAPSPTGQLHFGSLLAATASYLETRSRNGKWLVRIDDIDPPREVAGSAASILDELYRFGLKHDDLLYQSSRLDAYAVARDRLLQDGLAY
ncbi:MAG: glutamate--tRNA ligase family protein, partial [Xanthomonadales bacterium]|nr:glutamate--tRNA ligase family protein [Xanthomonadales bacterium]